MKQNNAVTFRHVPEALLVLFVALKLTGQIEWHWIWIAAPWWIIAGARFVVGVFVGMFTTLRRRRMIDSDRREHARREGRSNP